jgi:hypothetical protein
MATKAFRCPKCGKSASRFEGVGTIGETLVIEDGQAIYARDGDDFAPTHVSASCECGHVWRLRGVLDVLAVAEKLGLEFEPF